MNIERGRSRRNFLAAAVAAGAAATLGPWSARAAEAIDRRVAALARSAVSIDTHNHVDVPLDADGELPDIDLAGEMKRSGLSAICMTFAVDDQPIDRPGQAYRRFKAGLAAMDELLSRNGMSRALDLDDLESAHKARRPIVIQAVEGAHFLEGHAERVELAFQRGLRHFGLRHDGDAAPPPGGLTALEAEVIGECGRLGILVDLAHADAGAIAAALKMSSSPMIISHTGLDTRLGGDPDMARAMRPRLIGRDQALAVAEAGGVIGVWTRLAASPEEYAGNIRALADVVGVDHVCIGTDTRLTPAGGRGDRPGERTNQAWPGRMDGFYYTVFDAMLKAGFTPEEAGKIGGGNYCRLLGATVY